LRGDKSLADAEILMQQYIDALNNGADLAKEGDIAAIQALFSPESRAIGENLRVKEYSQDCYEFTVQEVTPGGGYAHWLTVIINMQEDEPFFYNTYSRYYRYVEPYVRELMRLVWEAGKNGDTGELAGFLAGGEGFVREENMTQAGQIVAYYEEFVVSEGRIKAAEVVYDPDLQLFIGRVYDGLGNVWQIPVSYGDGLIGISVETLLAG
jgi:hypothetical protein